MTVPTQPPRHRALKIFLLILLVAGVLVGYTLWDQLFRAVPQAKFASMEDQFKYGSIGTEDAQGLPYWLWLVLPRIFPDYLPSPGGYAALGMPWEPAHPLPVGFSKRRIGYDRVGLTCAFCHTATVRTSADQPIPTFYAGGPNHTSDILAYQRFLFRCASDPRFNADTILQEIASIYKLSPVERVVYRYLLVPGTRKALLKQKEQFTWTDTRPDWGRGRIDPFNPVKVSTLHIGVGDTIGNSDMMPIWNLEPRKGMPFHWDGLNDSIDEVFRSSSLGDGATPKSIPLEDLERLKNWLSGVKPPAFPFPVNAALAKTGEPIYQKTCAECHAFGGAKTGKIEPLASVGTDPHRLAMWTQEAADAYNAYAKDYPWKFSHFHTNNGYVNVPLDGVWIRAPYLHNGSVPSLADLLEKPEQRPKLFWRGYDVYEPVRGGFVTSGPEAEHNGSRFDVSEAGNSNAGHLWGTDLTPAEKAAVVEYMKTL